MIERKSGDGGNRTHGKFLPKEFPWTEGFDYIVNPETHCWEWTGTKTPRGHGTAYVRSLGHGTAHRLAYIALYGDLPKGVHIHHLCENPPCVNPAHLEPLTHSEHSAHHARTVSVLTEDDVVAMRTAVWDGERIHVVAERYGISATSCGLICQGKSWKDAGGPVGIKPRSCTYCDARLPLDESRNPRRRKYCDNHCRDAATNTRRREAA